MKNSLKFASVVLVIVGALVGCASQQSGYSVDHSSGSILLGADTKDQIVDLRPSNIQAAPDDVFIRRVTKKREETVYISIKEQQIMLSEAIMRAKIGVNFIPMNNDVDIKKRVDVYVDGMPFKDYIDYLSARSGYHLEIKGNKVYGYSFVEKTINVSSIIDGSNPEQWTELIELCNEVLSSNKNDTTKPYCTGLSSSGILSVGGLPNNVATLESLINKLDKTSKLSVLVDVKWLDISFGKKETLKQTTVVLKNNTEGRISFGNAYTLFSGKSSENGLGLEKSKIGLDFIIKPRVVGGRDVEVSINPVLSNVNDWTYIDSGFSSYDLPVIEFSNLNTRIVTRSDKPIQVGSFTDAEITNVISKQDIIDRDNGVQKEFEKEGNTFRKVIMVVNPKIISGV